MDRKDLLIAEESPQGDKTAKLKSQVDDMYILKATLETRGWKTIIAEYLNKRLTMDRFLQTKTAQDRHEAWGALDELTQFVNYLKRKIADGEEAVKILNKGGQV